MDLKWRNTFLVGVALLAHLSGCGSSGNPFESVPVSGKITYEDGSLIPVQGMRVFFHSLEPPKDGKHPRPAVVGVGADGTFKDVTTYKYADGLILGKYKVALESSKVPKEYRLPTTTPLVIEVTKSGQFLEIKVPKPKS